MPLTVDISGGENINQGEQVTLTATVTDANGNTPLGTLQYAWTANRGSFVGATDEASAVYHADFTDPSDVPVMVTCRVTRPANGWASDTGSDTEMFTAAALSSLSIEAIDEQFIPVLTKDYELEIDIGGSPERAYVDGDMEGFYQSWDAANAKIWLKSTLVTRLIQGAVWNVHLVKGTDTLDGKIIYNVVPTAPVIADPGRQILYRGTPFSLNIDIANKPTIVRASSLLVGLKHIPRDDGEDGLNIAGLLPADANLTETSFDAAIYAENNGGHDNLAVPFDIRDFPEVYRFQERHHVADDLLIYEGFDVASTDTPSLDTPSLNRSLRINTTNPVNASVDSDTKELYVLAEHGRAIHVFSTSGVSDGTTLSRTKRITLPSKGYGSYNGIVIDSNNDLIYLEHSGFISVSGETVFLKTVSITSTSTADGAEASFSREFTVRGFSTSPVIGFAVDLGNNKIYTRTVGVDYRDVLILDADTPNGTELDVSDLDKITFPNMFESLSGASFAAVRNMAALNSTPFLLTLMVSVVSRTRHKRFDLWNVNDITTPLKSLVLPGTANTVGEHGISFG